jgi:hypothetical protein
MQTGALQTGRVDPAVTAHVLRQILNALEAAHSRSIVHRDVKPENVMLQEVSGDPWFVKVLDFGLAKFVEERTETSLMVGTPAYMAPEQITRRNIGPWTDLYAVGVLAFRLITGRLPFQGDSAQETYAMKLDATYDPLSQAAGCDLPPLLAGFLRQAMARDPESRFRTAAEFRKAFDAVAGSLGQAGATTSPVGDPALGPLVDPTPRQERRRARDAQQGHSLTEQGRRIGDEAFAQVGAPSVLTTGVRRISSQLPQVVDRVPRKRHVGPFEVALVVLIGLAAGTYLVTYGPSLAPVRRWLAQAESYMDSELPATAGSAGSVGGTAPENRTAVVRLVTSPAGARFHNEDTGDQLGEAPADVLVPPGGTLRIHIQMKGYKDEVLKVTHADALHQQEWPVKLVREK